MLQDRSFTGDPLSHGSGPFDCTARREPLRVDGLSIVRRLGEFLGFDQDAVDRSLSYDPDVFTGFLPGTRIATNLGWRPVEAIAAGDLVATFDSGPRPVTAVTRERIAMSRSAPLLAIAPGVIGNTREMVMLPNQPVMIESDTAELLLGDPFAVVPAITLDGVEGVTRLTPTTYAEVIKLHFNDDEIIYAEGGALLLSFAHLPGTLDLGLMNPVSTERYCVQRGALLEYLLHGFNQNQPSGQACEVSI